MKSTERITKAQQILDSVFEDNEFLGGNVFRARDPLEKRYGGRYRRFQSSYTIRLLRKAECIDCEESLGEIIFRVASPASQELCSQCPLNQSGTSFPCRRGREVVGFY